MVQLTDELVARLDSESLRRGISRSALIREVLTEFLTDLRSNDVGRQIVAGYRLQPPHEPDEWGGLDGFADRASIELAQRLDEEERLEGHEPW